MIKRYLILIIALFAAIVTAFGQDCPVLKYSRGRLYLESGDGELFNLGGGPDAQKQGYSKIYYLFTDSQYVYISNYYYSSRDSYYDDYKYKLAIKSTDSTSCWFCNGHCYNGRVVSGLSVRKGGWGFSWVGRAVVLFDTRDDKSTDVNYTVALVVLPVPSRDTLLTGYKLTDKHIKNGNLTANLKIGRTGRIVLDSIWIDSIPQENVTYNNGGYQRDTPYYRNDPHAMVAIDIPVSGSQKRINVKVFYRLLRPDGNIIPQSEVLSVPIRIDVPFIHVIIAVTLGVILFAIILWVDRLRKKNKPYREAKRAESNRWKSQFEKQKGRIFDLEQQLKKTKDDASREVNRRNETIGKLNGRMETYKNEVAKLTRELEMARNREYTSEDSAEFRLRCDEVIKEIDVLYEELRFKGGDMSVDVVAEKVRQLEKIINIKRNK